jgi:formylglycine-generating enzyme required for sulfatase activity
MAEPQDGRHRVGAYRVPVAQCRSLKLVTVMQGSTVRNKKVQRKGLIVSTAAIIAVLLVLDWFGGGFSRRLVTGSAELEIASIPAGAAVFVDGEPAGSTPLTARIPPGMVVVKLTHPFHPDHVERLTASRGEHLVRTVTLAPANGVLRVVTNPKGAQVTLDGAALSGATPLVLDPILAGTHEVRMSIPGRATVARSVDVLPDAEAEVSVDLERIPMGVLVIQTTPEDAEVQFKGADLRYRSGMELPIGDYPIEVRRSGYAAKQDEVKVRVGRNVHTVQLEQQYGALRIRPAPGNATIEIHHGSGRLARTERYQDGMRLAAGKIEIDAHASGYRRYHRVVELGPGGLDLTVQLERIDAKAGAVIRDPMRAGGQAPAVVVIAPGTFLLGSTQVTLEQPFAIGVYEVTRAQYGAFTDATGAVFPSGRDDETDAHPVVKVDHREALAYTEWLSAQTQQRYRLPSEAEWQYVAAAGKANDYGLDDAAQPLCTYGNIADATAKERFREWTTVACRDGFVRTAPVGSFRPNAFGVYDLIGNVSEWVLDCWQADHSGARRDGSARLEAGCGSFVVKGGSWDASADEARVNAREPASSAGDDRGFRVLREF